MSTLYRKYRPSNFKEVVGQNHIKITLEHELKTGKIAHAYLFCGPRAVGKTTMARIFAKAVNCQQKKKHEYEPCNKCKICQEISQGKSLDVVEIDAASHTGVDNVRENIIAASRVSPSRAKYKVFIIDEVHMLSIGAFNALLKIMEEPPQNVIFILCTTEVHKVPTTIISRCQRFDFRRISVTDIVKKLLYITEKEKIKIDKKILEDIARRSEGHMRDAESLLGQIVAIGGREISQEEADFVIPRSNIEEVLKMIDYLTKKDAAEAIKLINKLFDEGIDLGNFLNNLIEILRKMMFVKINPTLTEKLGMEMGEDLEIKISRLARELSLEKLIVFLEKFSEAKNRINKSFILQLPVEITIVELCSLNVKPSPQKSESQQISAHPNRVTLNTTTNNIDINNPNAPKEVSPASVETPQPVAEGNLSYEHILEKWNEFLAKIKRHNHSLSFILQVCEPKNLNGNQLCLAFKYKFHQERINETNIKVLVEKVLRETYGQALSIEAVIDENLEINNNKNGNLKEKQTENQNPTRQEDDTQKQDVGEENMIDNLLKTFGGKVVN